MRKPTKSPFLGLILAPITSAGMGVAFKLRLLPFLKKDTILSGGRLVPTEDFANSMAKMFFVFSAVTLIIALAWIVLQIRRNKARNDEEVLK